MHTLTHAHAFAQHLVKQNDDCQQHCDRLLLADITLVTCHTASLQSTPRTRMARARFAHMKIVCRKRQEVRPQFHDAKLVHAAASVNCAAWCAAAGGRCQW